MAQDGFIIKASYMDTHLYHALHGVIGQLKISSYQLEIEISINACKPMEEQICQL